MLRDFIAYARHHYGPNSEHWPSELCEQITSLGGCRQCDGSGELLSEPYDDMGRAWRDPVTCDGCEGSGVST